MTITVAVVVGDGLVVASDSATTLQANFPDGHAEPIHIWNSADKIFNLRKGLPLAAMTWGRGTIQGRSISSHVKDLRQRLSGQSSAHADWQLDEAAYSMTEVVDRVKEFFAERLDASQPSAPMGLLVAGYGADDDRPALTELNIDAGTCSTGAELSAGEIGIFQWGQPEAIARLLDGVSQDLPQALSNLGVPANLVDPYTQAIKAQVARPFIYDSMPPVEAIQLAEWLVETTIKFVRFEPGHPTVGGPVEVAAVTRHEGFKWVKRKHYYTSTLNP
ncbi:hypothetical protein E4P40_02400 [Blastococcus sp. CT_GayMR20]|uniref:hypothetical protein n=1 Tax=Blastococcus sp. CT_GayMR20 TaxID=2559609 RepID=UPI001073BDBC|nr:hypothetical protein [Blastococcus sp. CT_GayMR20]TFV92602.1 hypothetical protein E4P40_02345 [Blastococcus sp. CT_GayMR20]TFV92611.1 hypothetical protein E4P40_02400 [Blastococcus sp. CT_GayMR20]